MLSYLPFRQYVTDQGLFLEWNNETENYDVVRKTYDSSGLGFGVNSSLVVSIPPYFVRHDYDSAVDLLELSLEMSRIFEE